jgi:hypothetical protein
MPARLLELLRPVHQAIAGAGSGAGACADAGHPPALAHLIGFTCPSAETAGEIELALRPVGGHPIDELAGFVAPPEWSALGVVAPGRAHAFGDRSPPPDRVVISHLVGRDGSSAWICEPLDGPASEGAADGLDDAGRGRIDDALRRGLGLPTHPAEHDPVALWARLWLDAVLAAVAADPARGWTWVDVALLHPAARLLHDQAPAAPIDRSEVADAVPRLAELLSDGRPWVDLRAACASGAWTVEWLPAELAAWMDDGIFSRWMLDGVTPCDELLDALGELVPAALVDRVRLVLDRWNVS